MLSYVLSCLVRCFSGCNLITSSQPFHLFFCPLQVNHTRNVHRIHAYGTDIPDPFETFDQLKNQYGVHSRIIQNIEAVGYQEPTPIQMQAVSVMLQVYNS